MRRGAWGLLILAAAAAACTPAARYKALSLLLDGVPPPADGKPKTPADCVAVSTASAAGAASPAGEPSAESLPAMQSLMTRDPAAGDVYHPPFQRQLCLFCHNFGAGTDRLRYPLPTLCFQCHGRLDQMGPHVMWPVKQGRCVTCHNPHQAPNAKLLRMAPPRLCFQCHNPDLLSHGTENVQCLSCHDPHSSRSPRLIKP